jgi:glutamine synthetase
MGIGLRWLFYQAEGGSSDCLVPVAIYPDPTRLNGYLVMTEVMNADGTPTSKIND